jgi:short-subunit dehydrogenase involved in D-alanine esterification of teichoic acids
VFEVIPPTVYDTELKGKPLQKSDWTVSSNEVADAVMKGLENNDYEISIGAAKNWLMGSKSDLETAFNNMNR